MTYNWYPFDLTKWKKMKNSWIFFQCNISTWPLEFDNGEKLGRSGARDVVEDNWWNLKGPRFNDTDWNPGIWGQCCFEIKEESQETVTWWHDFFHGEVKGFVTSLLICNNLSFYPWPSNMIGAVWQHSHISGSKLGQCFKIMEESMELFPTQRTRLISV